MAPPPSRSRKRSRRRQPPPSPLGEFFRHLSTRAILSWVATIGVVATAIVAYNNAHPLVEPYAPSTRGYTREAADEAAGKKVSPLEKWKSTWEVDYAGWRAIQSAEMVRIQLYTLQQNLVVAKKELEANPNSQIVRDQIVSLEKQIKTANARIEDYEASGRK